MNWITHVTFTNGDYEMIAGVVPRFLPPEADDDPGRVALVHPVTNEIIGTTSATEIREVRVEGVVCRGVLV